MARARTSSVRKTFCTLNPAGFRTKVVVTNASLFGRFGRLTSIHKLRHSIRYDYWFPSRRVLITPCFSETY